MTKDSSGDVIERNEYTYDVNDNRIAKSVDADGDGTQQAEVERYVHDGSEISLVFDGDGNQTERYFHGVGVDEVLAVEKAGDKVIWALADHQGTVRVLMDSTGAVINQLSYDSFGNITAQTNAGTSFGFTYTGREFDPETNNYYYRARYYDSDTGLFISQDPIGFDAGDSNLYRYVGNSPLNYTDPDGLLRIDL
ncbi:MAG: RHS repeat-associated core domain-containing protein, partial [Cyanobacteria bacterium J06638_38]